MTTPTGTTVGAIVEPPARRLAVVTAVGCSVGMLSAMVVGVPQAPSTSLEAVARHYSDSVVRARADIAVALFLLSALLLLWLLGWWRTTLDDAGSRRSASIVLASGVTSLALMAVAQIAGTAIPSATYDSDVFRVDPHTALLLEGLSWDIRGIALGVGALMVAVASTAARRSGLVPGWLGRSGQIWAVPTFLLGVFGIGLPLLLLWLVVMTVVVCSRSERTGRK